MMAFFYIGGLALSALFVSVLAATFSVTGLAKLFSGSAMAVLLMGASLEIAKFTTAAFLHRVWDKLHWIYKTYMFTAVVVLSLITSMGIFGFLSDAYQSSSSDLLTYDIQLQSLKSQRQRYTDEVQRLNKQIEDIPASRITKRAQLRAENEPQIKELLGKDNQVADQVRDMELKIVEIKNKVGPLIYIARAFDRDLDTVVKWLILVFVTVFDPLAICLVIATGEALRMRPLGYLDGKIDFSAPSAAPESSAEPSIVAPSQKSPRTAKVIPLNEKSDVIKVVPEPSLFRPLVEEPSVQPTITQPLNSETSNPVLASEPAISKEAAIPPAPGVASEPTAEEPVEILEMTLPDSARSSKPEKAS